MTAPSIVRDGTWVCQPHLFSQPKLEIARPSPADLSPLDSLLLRLRRFFIDPSRVSVKPLSQARRRAVTGRTLESEGELNLGGKPWDKKNRSCCTAAVKSGSATRLGRYRAPSRSAA